MGGVYSSNDGRTCLKPKVLSLTRGGLEKIVWTYLTGIDFDGVGSQRHHIVPIGELNGVPLALVARFGLISNSTDMIFAFHGDGVASKITTKEKVKSLALKAKVTREQTSDDSDSQGESDEDVDEEEAKAFKFLARNLRKFFCNGNQFGRGNRFGNGANKFGKGCGHFASECRKPKENKAFIGGIRRLFTSYKAYDGGHVVFGSNLKGKVVDGGYSQTSKAYIVLNKETMRIEESLNVTFDEGYPKSLKEARGHPINQVIGELNERKLRPLSKLEIWLMVANMASLCESPDDYGVGTVSVNSSSLLFLDEGTAPPSVVVFGS
nr:hypothetical protein [Tanacetum cinerariifolium]